MVANFDRYYQITKCFRDEDLRADRQPEFTQIDCETSFLTEQEIRDLFEDMIRVVFKNTLDIDLPNPFPVMDFATAMGLYGSDKPDMRVKLRIHRPDRGDEGRRVQGLRRRRQHGRRPRGRPARAAGRRDAAFGNRRLHPVRRASTAPRAWPTSRSTRRPRAVTACSRRSSRTCHDEALAKILELTGAQDGDLIFFGADKAKVVNDAIGALRVKIGHSRLRQEGRPVRRRLEAAVGGRLPDVRATTKSRAAGPRPTTRSPRRKTATKTCSRPIRAPASPRPTTWS